MLGTMYVLLNGKVFHETYSPTTSFVVCVSTRYEQGVTDAISPCPIFLTRLLIEMIEKDLLERLLTKEESVSSPFITLCLFDSL